MASITHTTSSCHDAKFEVIHDHTKQSSTLKIPQHVIDHMKIDPGDQLCVEHDTNGDVLITSVKYETVDIEFDQHDLMKYMLIAHERNITLNQLIEQAIEDKMKQDDYSTIEGCVRQSLGEQKSVGENMTYVDDDMILMSSQERDHEYIKQKQQRNGSGTTID